MTTMTIVTDDGVCVYSQIIYELIRVGKASSLPELKQHLTREKERGKKETKSGTHWIQTCNRPVWSTHMFFYIS